MVSRRTCNWIVTLAASVILLGAGAGPARADDDTADIEPAPRDANASWREIFRGPFRTSRLFGVPIADVVGAYQISLSGDASLLTLESTLSTSSVIAVGFGDIAQLEYRNAAAITTLEENPFGLPTVGVQLKAPFRRRAYVPDVAVALRFGLPRDEVAGDVIHSERATDLYLVARLPLWSSLRRVILHGGLRLSSAEIDSEGPGAPEDYRETLWLPAGGVQLAVGDDTALVAEVALVPRFAPGDAGRASDIDSGIFGRAGVRWRLLPAVVFDASVGYRIEIERLGTSPSSMANALVDWDIRLGGEVFVPWGALACKTARIFCD